ncbi:unnamed protein product [Porites lobata]|uniref:Uncharacterized protein n=1 Tax=Porites lobata TaxID=104759 RepID=A0ABN8N3X8_9CNID|nr:unnamed protein product [Porites lobata]
MNVGKLVASSNDNFIIFGGNCEETSLVVRKHCQFLCKDLKGTFAPERTSLGHPWKYEDRIKIANEVEKFKKTFSEKQLKEKQFQVLKEALAKSNIAGSCKKFSDIPNDSIISGVVTALQFEVKAKCLARKVKKLV